MKLTTPQDPYTSWVDSDGIYNMTRIFQAGVFHCGDFSCVTVTILVWPQYHLSDGNRKAWMHTHYSKLHAINQAVNKKEHCLILVANVAVLYWYVLLVVPSAATSLLDFKF